MAISFLNGNAKVQAIQHYCDNPLALVCALWPTPNLGKLLSVSRAFEKYPSLSLRPSFGFLPSPHEALATCSLSPFCLPAGPATAANSHRETLSEEADRDPGAGAAGPQLGHSGQCPSLSAAPSAGLTLQGALWSKEPAGPSCQGSSPEAGITRGLGPRVIQDPCSGSSVTDKSRWGGSGEEVKTDCKQKRGGRSRRTRGFVGQGRQILEWSEDWGQKWESPV